jgi:WD40 repeat protein
MRKLSIMLAIVSVFFGCTTNGQDYDRQLKSLSWSPNGERILYGGYDGNLRIMDVKTDKLITVRRTRTPFIIRVYWSQDGRRLLAITDQTVELFDSEGNEILLIVQNPPVSPNTGSHPQAGPNFVETAFSPDGTRLAVSGWTDGKVQVLDSQTGRIEIECLFPNTPEISSISWSPDGKKIAVGAWDKTVRVFEAGSGNQESRIEVDIEGWVRAKFSPAGDRLAWYGYETYTWVREMKSREVHKIKGKGDTRSIDWSPDSKNIAVLGREAVDIWNVEAQEKNKSLSVREWMDEVVWSPDGKYLATVSYLSGRTSIWSIEPGRNRRMNHAVPFGFSPDMEFISLGGRVIRFSRF